MGDAPNILLRQIMMVERAACGDSPLRMSVATRSVIPGELLSSRARFRFTGCFAVYHGACRVSTHFLRRRRTQLQLLTACSPCYSKLSPHVRFLRRRWHPDTNRGTESTQGDVWRPLRRQRHLHSLSASRMQVSSVFIAIPPCNPNVEARTSIAPSERQSRGDKPSVPHFYILKRMHPIVRLCPTQFVSAIA